MLVSLAVDFRHADVATRERFHVTEERLAHLYRTGCTGAIRELALVATCNRTELYAWLDADDRAEIERSVAALARRWMRTRGGAEALLALGVRRSGADAARHIARVASGLESQILGDGQILGQLREAYRHASRAIGSAPSPTGPVLHRLFETALRTGKRVQTETSLSAGRNSVGAEAAAVALARFGTLENTRCVIVGAGRTGQRAAKQLHALGARDLVVLNRTLARAQELASYVGGRAASMETLHVEAALADVVVVATGSPSYVLRADALARAREGCAVRGYALLLLDLGVPRNIDPRAIGEAGVTLLDLDTLHQPVQAAEELRREAVPHAETIVAEEVAAFTAWLASMPARDAIRPLRMALEDVARREVAFVAGDEGVAERTATRIVAKLLAGPMAALRRAVARGEPLDAQAMMLLEMFAPDDTAARRAVPGPSRPTSHAPAHPGHPARAALGSGKAGAVAPDAARLPEPRS